MQDGIRITVHEFRSAGSARCRGRSLLAEGLRRAPRRDRLRPAQGALSVTGVPGARGVVVDNRTRTGSPTKIATIVFAKGQFTFRLSTEAKPGSLRVGQLERASRRMYRRLAA